MHIIHGFYMECVYSQVASNFTNNNSLRTFHAIDINIHIIHFSHLYRAS
jgi:hypothetical protein